MLGQVGHWCSYGRSDKVLVKALVVVQTVATVASIAVTAFNIAYMFHLFVWGYAEWFTLLQVDYMLNHMIISTVVIITVQIFYTSRAYALNSNVFLPLVVAAGILLSLGGAISAHIIGSQSASLSEPNMILRPFYCWTGGILLVDIVLTASIGYGLWRHRTGWAETRRLIIRLIRISFEAQVPPTIIALAMIILFGTNFPSAWPIGLELFHSKVYITGMLAVLNVRSGLRRSSESTGNSKEMSGSGGGATGSGNGIGHRDARPVVFDTTNLSASNGRRESIKLSPLKSFNSSSKHHQPPTSSTHERSFADVPSSIGRIDEAELATITTLNTVHPSVVRGEDKPSSILRMPVPPAVLRLDSNFSIKQEDLSRNEEKGSFGGGGVIGEGEGGKEEVLKRARSGEEWLLEKNRRGR